MESQTAVVDGVEGGDNPEGAEEDGAVRCICGNPDYQGPTSSELELQMKSGGTKDGDSKGDAATLENAPDPDGALFIQCDTCETWQHGPCVGIMTNDATPENYFCEECRKDLHQIIEGPNG